MHAIKDRPVVVNGQIVIRPIMVVALTYDHRLLDGREAVTFLGTSAKSPTHQLHQKLTPWVLHSQGPGLHRGPEENAAHCMRVVAVGSRARRGGRARVVRATMRTGLLFEHRNVMIQRVRFPAPRSCLCPRVRVLVAASDLPRSRTRPAVVVLAQVPSRRAPSRSPRVYSSASEYMSSISLFGTLVSRRVTLCRSNLPNYLETTIGS